MRANLISPCWGELAPRILACKFVGTSLVVEFDVTLGSM